MKNGRKILLISPLETKSILSLLSFNSHNSLMIVITFAYFKEETDIQQTHMFFPNLSKLTNTIH